MSMSSVNIGNLYSYTSTNPDAPSCTTSVGVNSFADKSYVTSIGYRAGEKTKQSEGCIVIGTCHDSQKMIDLTDKPHTMLFERVNHILVRDTQGNVKDLLKLWEDSTAEINILNKRIDVLENTLESFEFLQKTLTDCYLELRRDFDNQL